MIGRLKVGVIGLGFFGSRYARTPYLQHYREAFDAIPVLDALVESARSGQPGSVMR